jgi:hypothetical protein
MKSALFSLPTPQRSLHQAWGWAYDENNVLMARLGLIGESASFRHVRWWTPGSYRTIWRVFTPHAAGELSGLVKSIFLYLKILKCISLQTSFPVQSYGVM